MEHEARTGFDLAVNTTLAPHARMNEKTTMKGKHTFLPAIFLFSFLVLTGGLAMYLPRPPEALPATAAVNAFSAERAFRHVEVLGREVHPIGSPAQTQVREYIVRQLQELRLVPEIQKTAVVDPQALLDARSAVAANVQNIVARLPGTGSRKAILLVSHYDSVATAPGGSDDSSGVAALLETARALLANAPLKNDVIFLFVDGEEVGLLGARAFVAQHRWAKDVGLVLNFDTGGDTGIVYTYETSPGNAGLIAEYAKAVPYPMASSMMYEVYRTMPNNSDFTVFKRAGIPGLNFAHIGGKFRYHTLTDTPANLDLRSLQHQGSYMLSLTQHFGNLNLENIRRDADLVYFGVLNLGMVYYPETWALPLGLLAALLFVALLAAGWRRGRISAGQVLLGTLGFIFTVVGTAGVVWLLWQVVLKLYPRYAALVDIPNGWLYWLACLALAVACTAALYNLLRRYARLDNLVLGAALCWLVLALMLGQRMPGVSYYLDWPLLFALGGLGLSWLLPEPPSAPWRRAVLLAATALPALLFGAPMVYGFYIALGTDLILVPVLVLLLLQGLLLPHLALIARPARWALPAFAGSVAIGAVIAGSLTAAPDASNPQSDSLSYTLNADTNQALWISEDAEPDTWTAQFLGTDFKRMQLPEIKPDLSKVYLTAAAPVFDVRGSLVELVSHESIGERHAFHLHVSTPDGVSFVAGSITSSSPIAAITFAGTRIPDSSAPGAPRSSWYEQRFQYWVPPADGFDVTVELAQPGSAMVSISDQRLGLQVPGLTYRPRPADRMPLGREFLPDSKTDRVIVSRSFVFGP